MLEKEINGVIGLEIHVYLVTKEKLFCRCKAVREKGVRPNSFICPICTGQPGAKPMLPNRAAVEKAVQIALMLNCKLNGNLVWKRKHYNWPDLPKGYQNTLSGAKAFPVGVNGNFYGVRIKEMHLEEDPASWEPSTGNVDYNRSGFPLIEIVTEPDFCTAKETQDWLKKLQHNLEYLKAVSSDSGMKADVNVSIRGKTERVEVKNVNSIENVARTIEFELRRQVSEGSVRETRRFDEAKGKTIRMRGKETEDDYRFISDPDLRNLVLSREFIDKQKKKVPESPDVKLEKLVKKYKIGARDAVVLAKNIDLVSFFEKVAEKIDAKFALPWVTVELLRFLNYNKTFLDRIELKVEHFVDLLKLVKEGKITELQGKSILNKFYPASFSPMSEAINGKIDDKASLEKICKEVIAKENDVVARYRSGDRKLINFLIGEVMKRTEKRADFRVVREVMERLLS